MSALPKLDREYLSDGMEEKAQAILFPAIEALQVAAMKARCLSRLRHDEIGHLLDALDDYTPDRRKWDEQIAEQSP